MLRDAANLLFKNIYLLANLSSSCYDIAFLKVIFAIKKVFNIILIIVPIILIVSLTIHLFKFLMYGDVKKEDFKKPINSLIAAVLIFFLPTILDVVIGLVDSGTGYHLCWENATSEYISALEQRYQLSGSGSGASGSSSSGSSTRPGGSSGSSSSSSAGSSGGTVSASTPGLATPTVSISGDKVTNSLSRYANNSVSFFAVNQNGDYLAHNLSKTWYTKSSIKLPLIYFSATKQNMRFDYMSGTVVPINSSLWSAAEADPNKIPYYSYSGKNSDTVANFVKYTLQNSNNLAYMNMCLTYATKGGFKNWVGTVVGNSGRAQYSCWQNSLTAVDMYKLLAHIKADRDNIRSTSNGVTVLNGIWSNAANCKTGGMNTVSGASRFNVYNKTGSGDGNYHDIGIVENKNNKNKYFIYVVFTMNQSSSNTRDSILNVLFNEFSSSIS